MYQVAGFPYLSQILSFLEIYELSRLTRISRAFHKYINDEHITIQVLLRACHELDDWFLYCGWAEKWLDRSLERVQSLIARLESRPSRAVAHCIETVLERAPPTLRRLAFFAHSHEDEISCPITVARFPSLKVLEIGYDGDLDLEIRAPMMQYFIGSASALKGVRILEARNLQRVLIEVAPDEYGSRSLSLDRASEDIHISPDARWQISWYGDIDSVIIWLQYLSAPHKEVLPFPSVRLPCGLRPGEYARWIQACSYLDVSPPPDLTAELWAESNACTRSQWTPAMMKAVSPILMILWDRLKEVLPEAIRDHLAVGPYNTPLYSGSSAYMHIRSTYGDLFGVVPTLERVPLLEGLSQRESDSGVEDRSTKTLFYEFGDTLDIEILENCEVLVGFGYEFTINKRILTGILKNTHLKRLELAEGAWRSLSEHLETSSNSWPDGCVTVMLTRCFLVPRTRAQAESWMSLIDRMSIQYVIMHDSVWELKWIYRLYVVLHELWMRTRRVVRWIPQGVAYYSGPWNQAVYEMVSGEYTANTRAQLDLAVGYNYLENDRTTFATVDDYGRRTGCRAWYFEPDSHVQSSSGRHLGCLDPFRQHNFRDWYRKLLMKVPPEAIPLSDLQEYYVGHMPFNSAWFSRRLHQGEYELLFRWEGVRVLPILDFAEHSSALADQS